MRSAVLYTSQPGETGRSRRLRPHSVAGSERFGRETPHQRSTAAPVPPVKRSYAPPVVQPQLAARSAGGFRGGRPKSIFVVPKMGGRTRVRRCCARWVAPVGSAVIRQKGGSRLLGEVLVSGAENSARRPYGTTENFLNASAEVSSRMQDIVTQFMSARVPCFNSPTATAPVSRVARHFLNLMGGLLRRTPADLAEQAKTSAPENAVGCRLNQWCRTAVVRQQVVSTSDEFLRAPKSPGAGPGDLKNTAQLHRWRDGKRSPGSRSPSKRYVPGAQ